MRKPKRDGRAVDSPMATRLRAEGFIPLPRLWVRGDDLPAIHKITDHYKDSVNEVRVQVKTEMRGEPASPPVVPVAAAPVKSSMTRSAAYDKAERQRAQEIEETWEKYFR